MLVLLKLHTAYIQLSTSLILQFKYHFHICLHFLTPCLCTSFLVVVGDLVTQGRGRVVVEGGGGEQ